MSSDPCELHNKQSTWFHLTIKWFILIYCYWAVSGCSIISSVIDFDRNRVITPESSAIVGPVVDASSKSNEPLEEKADTIPPLENKAIINNSNRQPQESLEKNSGADQHENKPVEVVNKTPPHENEPVKNITKTDTQKNEPVKKITKTDTQKNKPVKKITKTNTPKIKPVKKVAKGAVKGRILITGAKNKTFSPKGAIVNIKRVDGKTISTQKTPKIHIVDMEKKQYLPRYISVNKQDSLSFVNKDNIKHNVFSSSRKNAFDLGTYGGGLKREVSLNNEGIVKVYCNIHRGMAMFVSIADKGISTVADTTGEFEIDDLPPGEYLIHIWHLRGEYKKTITVQENKTTELQTTISSSKFKYVEHKNKFGKKYSKAKRGRYGNRNDSKSESLEGDFF
jgi:plastocyanin